MLLQIPSWLEFIWDQFNLFLDWYVALDISAQILVGILIFMGLIAVTQIIKGVIWITKESVKASLLITFIILYLIFAGFKMAIVAIVNVKTVDNEWKHVVDNIKWLVDRFYPEKKKHKKQEPIIIQEQPEPVQPPQIYVIKERESVKIEEKKPKPEYCHNCGSPFSLKMFEMLHEKGFAFCDQCGAKYTAE
ncbi:MAG: hypothetical protein JW776_13705 [Candidatus Lokiarchaeota archaeon]|nr:hypothetical protein [Candidatus Lokiarchaeota archaeon]